MNCEKEEKDEDESNLASTHCLGMSLSMIQCPYDLRQNVRNDNADISLSIYWNTNMKGPYKNHNIYVKRLYQMTNHNINKKPHQYSFTINQNRSTTFLIIGKNEV